MEIRVLVSADAEKCQALRLQALLECPTAFSSSYEEEYKTSLAEVAQRLTSNDTVVFGGFDDQRLVGTAVLHREQRSKRAHVAVVWGMYVDPDFRNRGVGRELLDRLLSRAAGMRELHKITLGVNAANRAAIALYEGAGFRSYGVEPGFLLVDGALQDEVHMAFVFASSRTGGRCDRQKDGAEHHPMKVRPAHPADAEGIATIHVRGWQSAYRGIVPNDYLDSLSVVERAQFWRSLLQNSSPSELVVADAAVALVGWASFGPSRDAGALDSTGELYAVYVLPDHWSTGIGRALWQRAKERLAERGFLRATLWVLSANVRAIRFYSAAGFVPTVQRTIEIGGVALPEVRYELPIG